MINDIIGLFIGTMSCLSIYFLFKYADSLSNGNVGADE